MDPTNELSQEERTEYDQLTQEEGDYLAPTQAPLVGRARSSVMIPATTAGCAGYRPASRASNPSSGHQQRQQHQQHQQHHQQQHRQQQLQQHQQGHRQYRQRDHRGRRRQHSLSASSQSAAALAYYSGGSQQQASATAIESDAAARDRQTQHGSNDDGGSGSFRDRGRGRRGPDYDRQEERDRRSERPSPRKHPPPGGRSSPSARKRIGRGAGGKGGAAAAAAEARTPKNQDSIKDTLGHGLKERLCADNSERFRRTPGSFRKPPVLAEARSAAADAAMGEAMPSNPPPLFLPVVFVSAGSLVGSVAHDPDSRARAIGGGSGDGGDRRGSSTDRGSKCGVDGGASGDSGGGGARGGGGGDCVAARKGSERKEPGGKGPLGGSPPRMRMPRKAVRQASFEKHTKAFGSRFLERNGFDGTTGVRENEYVITFADKALEGARRRGGNTGGLGYDKRAAEAAAAGTAGVPASPVTAPCDMDPSLQRGNPPKSYYGITVEFPFEAPMVPQDQMMQRIIAALKSKKHALLESPTGTGKSAAFTSAALAWQRDEVIRTGKAPQIFYGARTHTQLEQMVKVLKSLPYCPTMATLGSRERMCINPMVVGDGLANGEEEPGSEDDVNAVADRGDNHPGWATQRGNGGKRWSDGAVGGGGGGGGVTGERGEAGRGNRRRWRPSNPKPSQKSVLETCQTLRSTADRHNKHNTHLKLPGGAKVPYDRNAPDLTLDLANIEGSLEDKEKKGAACPFYRCMTAPRVHELAHEFARPKVGLASGDDGAHAIEDLRAFCADPQGFSDKRKGERGRQGGCGDGGGGAECGSGGCAGSDCGGGADNADNADNANNGRLVHTSVSCAAGASRPPAAAPARVELSYDTSGDTDEDEAVAKAREVTASAGLSSPAAIAAGTAWPAGARKGPGRKRRGHKWVEDPAATAATEDEVGSPATVRAAAVSEGQEEGETRVMACPYYMSQELAKQAQIVMMPYNYILDPSIRSSMSLPLAGAVVILDEAHNVEGVCRDAGSLELPLLDMVNMASDLCDLRQVSACRENADVLLTFVMALVHFTARESQALEVFQQETEFTGPREKKRVQEEIVKHWACDNAGRMFWADLAGRGEESISHTSLERAMEDLKLGMLENKKAEEEGEEKNEGERKEDGFRLKLTTMTPALRALEKVIFVTGLALNHPHDYNINVTSWKNAEHKKFPAHNRTSSLHTSCPLQASPFCRSGYVPLKMCQFNVWLLSPSVVFDDVATQPHSTILTSGTLSPLHSMKGELGRSFGERLLPFPQQALEANHVIKPGHQLKVIPVGQSPGKMTLKCVKDNMANPKFLNELGLTILSLAQHIPSGVLVFLSSYKLLREAVGVWKSSGVWSGLKQCKGVVVEEPAAAAEFKDAKRRYETAIDSPGKGKGSALLLAVYRGKMSEGISFNDHYARGVLCVGIPFPNMGDPKVKAKKCYNTWKSLGRRPTDQDRGAAGPRSWPAICAAGDHGFEGDADCIPYSSRSSTSSTSGGGGGGGGGPVSPTGKGGSNSDIDGPGVGGDGGPGVPGGRDAPLPAAAVVVAAGRERGAAIGPPRTSKKDEAAVAAVARVDAAEAQEAAAARRAARAAVAAARAAEEAGRALLSGQDWYLQEAFRAENQALGRCIRHIYDYGVICLIDERFRLGGTTHVKYLAKWMRGLLGEYSSLADMGDTMDKLFASAPGFVQAEKDKAARLRQEASVRRQARATAQQGTGTAGASLTAAAAGTGSGSDGRSGAGGGDSGDSGGCDSERSPRCKRMRASGSDSNSGGGGGGGGCDRERSVTSKRMRASGSTSTGGGAGCASCDVDQQGSPRSQQHPVITPPIQSREVSSASSSAAAGMRSASPLAVVLPSPHVEKPLSASSQSASGLSHAGCGGNGGGSRSCCQSFLRGDDGGNSAHREVPSSAQRQDGDAASGVVVGGDGGNGHGEGGGADGSVDYVTFIGVGVDGGGFLGGGDGGSGGARTGTSGRPSDRGSAGKGSAVGTGVIADAVGADSSTSRGDGDRAEEEEEEEEENDGDDVDVIDLTAMDVVLTQEEDERAAVSLMYDGAGDY